MLSAHRDPRGVAEYASTAAMRGTRVLIAGAGMAAALPGVVAAYTDLPVIGVPLTSSKSVMGGLDALLSIVQMPPEFRWRASLERRAQRGDPGGEDLGPGGGYPGTPGRPVAEL